MPRSSRSEIAVLLQEARGLELLASEVDVPPDRLQDYWDLSSDLITLVTDIEEYERAAPDAGYEDPNLLDLKRRVRALAGRLNSLATPV